MVRSPVERFAEASWITTENKRSWSAYGNGSSKTLSITLNMAVVAPMPRASVSTARAVKPGCFRSTRTANFKSNQTLSSQAKLHKSQTASWSDVRFPSRRAEARTADSGVIPCSWSARARKSVWRRISSSRSSRCLFLRNRKAIRRLNSCSFMNPLLRRLQNAMNGRCHPAISFPLLF